MRNAATLATILAMVLSTLPCQANFDRCGKYELEGYVDSWAVNGDKYLFLVLERGARSEIRVRLRKYTEGDRYRVGTNVSARVQVEAACLYDCKGKLLKIDRPLEPDALPKSFFDPQAKPYAETKCKSERR